MIKKIPVVDVAPLCSDEEAEGLNGVVEKIGEACHDWGFFQVVNHGVSDVLIDRVWGETRRFFSLPRHVKLSITRTKDNPRGYYDRELTKNARDLKEVFDFANVPFPDLPDEHPKNRATVDGLNQWPATLPTFKPTMTEYFEACELLGRKFLEAFCLGLGVPRDTLHRHFTENHTSFVRLNYYPLDDPLGPAGSATSTPLGDMALHHHTDAGALTILLQDDVGGLEVFGGDEWLHVEPVEGAFVINIGDMMQVWSNDRYRAALHRVMPRKERERFSIPFFFNPPYDTDCVPLQTLAGSAPRYRRVNWGEFRQARTDGDYADYGKEIQIEDYRIG